MFVCICRLDGSDNIGKRAKVGVTETTKELTEYVHPTNPKIKFWDLPGIGTPNYPEKTYCEKVKLDKFDAFLIFTSDRFKENDLKLAKKIKSIHKKFFFIRTKIDQDVRNEKHEKRQQNESFNEDAMLMRIRGDCSKNLAKQLRSEEDIFLISNHFPAKWDFGRLSKAILDELPTYQRESLTFGLSSLSTDILKEKAEILKGRMWIVASASAVGAAIPVPGLSIAVDFGLISHEISFYRSQLGFPKEGSSQFWMLSLSTQDSVRAIWQMIADVVKCSSTLLAANASELVAEEFVRFIPIVGSAIAGGMSFASTYFILKHYLKKMEEMALKVVEEVAKKMVDDFEMD